MFNDEISCKCTVRRINAKLSILTQRIYLDEKIRQVWDEKGSCQCVEILVLPPVESSVNRSLRGVNLTFRDYRVIHIVIHFSPPTPYEGTNLRIPAIAIPPAPLSMTALA